MNNFSQELAWTHRHMPLTQNAINQLPDMAGVRLVCSIHLDIKLVPLIEGLLARNTAVFLTTCNPTTVRDNVVTHLQAQGASAHAWHNMAGTDYTEAINRALAWQPTHLCEMGADLTTRIHQQPATNHSVPVKAALEATGSGINRLLTIGQPRYPIFNWDDLPVKEGLHNRYMVGLSAWQTFVERTHLTLQGKQVLVIGYGLVGQGVAEAARAFGGSVIVAEKDPARAWQARFGGWQVVDQLTAVLPLVDVIATATGAPGIIGPAEIPLLKSGTFVLNIGHVSAEIDMNALRQYPYQTVLPHIEAFNVQGKTIYLLAAGSMFNLTAGYGDSLNAFDITLAVMTAGIGHIVGAGETAEPGVHLLPQSVWETVL